MFQEVNQKVIFLLQKSYKNVWIITDKVIYLQKFLKPFVFHITNIVLKKELTK